MTTKAERSRIDMPGFGKNGLRLAKTEGRMPLGRQRGLPVDSVQDEALLSGRAMPRTIAALLALVIGTSFHVVMEPAPTDLLFVALFLVFLASRSVRKPIDLNPVLSLGLLLFVLGHLVSLFAFRNLARAIIFGGVTAYLLVFWYVIVALVENYGATAVRLIRLAFLFAAVSAVTIGLLVPYFPSLVDLLGLRDTLGPRAQGAFKDPNVYSPFLCAAFMLVLNDLVTRRLSLRSIALLGLFAVGIQSAFSRGAYVNLAVALATFVALHVVLVHRRQWLIRGVTTCVVLVAVVTPVVLLYIEAKGLDEFFYGRLQMQSYDDSRFSAQILALLTLGESPLGVGPGQSDIVLPISPHNLYLRVATENGILGIIGWLLFLLTTFWICLEGVARRGPFRDVYTACLAIIMGIVVNSLVIDSLHWRHLFLFLALPIGLARYERWQARSAVAAAATRS
jgi:O-antigen ligase